MRTFFEKIEGKMRFLFESAEITPTEDAGKMIVAYDIYKNIKEANSYQELINIKNNKNTCPNMENSYVFYELLNYYLYRKLTYAYILEKENKISDYDTIYVIYKMLDDIVDEGYRSIERLEFILFMYQKNKKLRENPEKAQELWDNEYKNLEEVIDKHGYEGLIEHCLENKYRKLKFENL